MVETNLPQPPLLKRVFISSQEKRLRAGWRLLIQTALLIFFSIFFGLPVALLGWVLPGFELSLTISQIVEVIAITLSVFLARRWLDRRSIVSLGLHFGRHVLREILIGILMTFVIFGFTYTILSIAGWVHFEGFAWQSMSSSHIAKEILWSFLLFTLVGWNEELLSRGYHLQTLASGLNLTWGAILSSAIFGLLHLGNPNATWASAAGIFFAGLFLAYAYIRTKQLWLSIGLHIGWNFFEGPIFGFPVSGLDTFRLMKITVSGPELWTGGAFGPEAGLVILPALALGAVLIYLYTRPTLAIQPENEISS
jgi:membrane protease YdiL (CAAX protease family)